MTEGGPYRIGQKFGPYTLEAYLGAGAFKSVYRAKNEGALTEAAFVALGFPHQQDAEGIAALTKEATMASRLIHPHILRVYGIEKHEGVTFLVMECLAGRTLGDRLLAEKRLSQDEAVRYAGLIAEALAYAHGSHIVHRDVKPANIFLQAGGAPKLMDFGIARLLEKTNALASTRCGTIEYMAPELFRGAAGMNADIWSLGITLYEMLVGERPFTGQVGDVLQNIMMARYDEKPLQARQVDARIIRVLRNMLAKEPERRYQRAEELIRDMETAARRTRLMDNDESRLEVLVRASFPLIYIVSFEEDRVIAALRGIGRRLAEDTGKPRPVYIWSASCGLRDEKGQLVNAETAEDPTVALTHIIENRDEGIYLFLDMHRHFTPVITRLIRDAARAVRSTKKSLLFLSPLFQAPPELEKEVNLVVFRLPDREHLEPVLDRIAERCRSEQMTAELSAEQKDAVIRAAAGLTLTEAERVITLAAMRSGGLLPKMEREIVAEKTQIIRKTGILEYHHTSESFRAVGGLEQLLAWFEMRTPIFASAFRYPGLPQPKGVLLVGVPGCGKSLSARALAGAWGVPLLRLDVGRIFGSIVGSSEYNLRRAIQTAEAVSPCVLWIDEVEKGFSGVQGQGGGGVAARVFGAFLTWLQDKKSPVFVVATANDLSGIPPEFLRKGRFDEVFFVGLPDQKQREAIFRIHLTKRRRDPAHFDVRHLTDLSANFSGAEIEEAVIGGLFRAFAADREVATSDLTAAVRDIHPLARARAGEIAAITRWAKQNARWAG